MIIFRAELQTRNYTFDCFGLTEKEARRAMRRALMVHFQCDEEKTEIFMSDVNIFCLELGEGYRDGTKL